MKKNHRQLCCRQVIRGEKVEHVATYREFIMLLNNTKCREALSPTPISKHLVIMMTSMMILSERTTLMFNVDQVCIGFQERVLWNVVLRRDELSTPDAHILEQWASVL